MRRSAVEHTVPAFIRYSITHWETYCHYLACGCSNKATYKVGKNALAISTVSICPVCDVGRRDKTHAIAPLFFEVLACLDQLTIRLLSWSFTSGLALNSASRMRIPVIAIG